jgi:two-component system sensor histidine kinase RegB
MHDESTATHPDFDWLIRLRWGAVVGQVVSLVVVEWFMSVSVAFGVAAGLIGAVGASNLVLVYWRNRTDSPPAWVFGGILAADILLFTGLLAVSGGANNPFSFLYVLYIALGAVMLRGYYPWLIAGIAIAGYGSLYLAGIGLQTGDAGGHHAMHRHLYGMWFAMAVTGAMIAYFVTMIGRELDRRRRALREMREIEARREKLASLATVATGAAHELSTPISTIAVVSRELELMAEERGADQLADDAGVIRGEVDRCQKILDRMAADAGGPAGAALEQVDPMEAARRARRKSPEPGRVAIDGECDPADRVAAPAEALVDNLAAVIENALQASAPDGEVTVAVRRQGDRVAFVIHDDGCGMDEKTRRRAVEPFFSTREPGEGMGLGLYLARELVDGLGGDFAIDSQQGEGTTVTMRLPIDEGERREQ